MSTQENFPQEINDANDMNLYENYIPLYHARKNNIYSSLHSHKFP